MARRRCCNCKYLKRHKRKDSIGICILHGVAVADTLCGCESDPKMNKRRRGEQVIDFRNYADLIRKLVKEADKKDPNWKWSVKSIGKNKVRIRWGYLDYLEAKENCFSIKMDPDNTEDDQWMLAHLPDGSIIEVFLVVEGKPNPNLGAEQSIQAGIEDAIWEITHYAHSRY